MDLPTDDLTSKERDKIAIFESQYGELSQEEIPIILSIDEMSFQEFLLEDED